MATTRLEYRDPKKPRAVCVYTIAQESRHVIIENIPDYGVITEFIKHCKKFGHVEKYRELYDHPSNTKYEDVCLVSYTTIAEARWAKHKMDDKQYYYKHLRVSYAPEYETVNDIRVKFQDRYHTVYNRLIHGGDNFKRRRKAQVDNNTEAKVERMESLYGPLERQYQLKADPSKPLDNKMINEISIIKRRKRI